LGASEVIFKASHGWFQHFEVCLRYHSLNVTGEAASAVFRKLTFSQPICNEYLMKVDILQNRSFMLIKRAFLEKNAFSGLYFKG
jgi:hypothetical protein